VPEVDAASWTKGRQEKSFEASRPHLSTNTFDIDLLHQIVHPPKFNMEAEKEDFSTWWSIFILMFQISISETSH